MSMEIKFRGFNRKNGRWLYGYYLRNRGAHFVCADEFADGRSWEDYEIDPASLGQFVGREDKNGREVYEGDIVYDGDTRYLVQWDSMDSCFALKSKLSYRHLPILMRMSVEVVGNFYDSPDFS